MSDSNTNTSANNNNGNTATQPTFVTGTQGDDALKGTGSIEVFYGAGGSDVMTANGSKDIFVIDGLEKRVEITNFNASHDMLYLGSTIGASSLTSLLADAKLTSAGLEIDAGATTIVLDGVTTLSALSSIDVHFFQGNFPIGELSSHPAPSTPPTSTPPATTPSTTPSTSPSAPSTEARTYAIGTSGNDTLVGKGANEVFYGAGGSDVMTANGSRDVFIIDSLNKRVEITNFNPSHDMIYISSNTGLTSLQAWHAAAYVNSNGALEVDTANGTSIVLDGIASVSALGSSNVGFFQGNYTGYGSASNGGSGSGAASGSGTAPSTGGGSGSGDSHGTGNGGTQGSGDSHGTTPSTTPSSHSTVLPLAGAANALLNTGGWLPVASLYAAKAPDGATITAIKFTDVGQGGSYFDLNGQMTDNGSVTVTPDQLAKLHLDAGATGGNYTFQVSVEDSNGHWSAAATGHLTVIGVTSPASIHLE